MDGHLGQDSGTVGCTEVLHKLSLALPCLMEEIKVLDKLLIRLCSYP